MVPLARCALNVNAKVKKRVVGPSFLSPNSLQESNTSQIVELLLFFSAAMTNTSAIIKMTAYQHVQLLLPSSNLVIVHHLKMDF